MYCLWYFSIPWLNVCLSGWFSAILSVNACHSIWYSTILSLWPSIDIQAYMFCHSPCYSVCHSFAILPSPVSFPSLLLPPVIAVCTNMTSLQLIWIYKAAILRMLWQNSHPLGGQGDVLYGTWHIALSPDLSPICPPVCASFYRLFVCISCGD